MLARDFLSAKSLGISEVDRKAAIEVLRRLEAGELKYVEPLVSTANVLSFTGCDPGGFNMIIWPTSDHDLPGPGCVGFWMERVKGRELSLRCHEKFDDVFNPWDWHRVRGGNLVAMGRHLTPERCAWALRTKLQTGRADWGER
jgi:hypothetical protein